MAVLAACTLEGRLSWISDPVSGSRHDNFTVKDSSVLHGADPKDYVGDKGFVGNDMITPFRKPAGGELLDWQKEFNTQVNKIRWVIDQVIGKLRMLWRSMRLNIPRRATGQRRKRLEQGKLWAPYISAEILASQHFRDVIVPGNQPFQLACRQGHAADRGVTAGELSRRSVRASQAGGP
jgi:hypothetical protein